MLMGLIETCSVKHPKCTGTKKSKNNNYLNKSMIGLKMNSECIRIMSYIDDISIDIYFPD